jgi:hypothetical protein
VARPPGVRCEEGRDPRSADGEVGGDAVRTPCPITPESASHGPTLVNREPLGGGDLYRAVSVLSQRTHADRVREAVDLILDGIPVG